MVPPNPVSPFDDWRYLGELAARKSVFGPLAESVRVRLYDRGVGVQLQGMMGAIGRHPKDRFPFSALEASEAGDSVRLTSPDATGHHHVLVGHGARLLSRVLGVLDEARKIPAVAAAAEGRSSLGLSVRGVALGGARGIVLIPNGLYGLLPGGAAVVDLDSVLSARWDAGVLHVETADGPEHALKLKGDHVTARAFGDWWAGAREPLPETDDAVLSGMWADDSGHVSPARVELIDGGLRLRSTSGPERLVRSSGIWLELESTEHTPGDRVRVTLRVREAVHRVWLAVEGGGLARLRAHLARHRLSAWPEDFDPRKWSSCEGTWAAARVLVPGTDELVLREATVRSLPTGLVVSSDHEGAASLRSLPRGLRVRVELLTDRSGLRFTAVVLDQGAGCVQCGEDDGPSGGVVLSLFPMGQTERRASRRARHRVEVLDDIPVELRTAHPPARWWGHVHDLSAEGAGVVFSGDTPAVGTVVDVRLPVQGGGKVMVRAEVLHASPDGPGATRLGLRVTYATERVRAMFQREVLRHERRAVQLKKKETLLTEDLPLLPGALGPRRDAWVEEETLDLT